MRESERIKHLRTLVQIYGPSWVAVQLNYRDSRPIDMWIRRKKVPSARTAAVDSLIEKEIFNADN